MSSYFAHLSPVIMGVVGILVFFSLGSWAIMAWKVFQIGFARKRSREFLDYFWETKDFAEIERGLAEYEGSPIALVFREGFHETKNFLDEQPQSEPQVASLEAKPAIKAANTKMSAGVSGMDNISRSLHKAAWSEEDRLERNLSFLATTASVTPFIGLFGTVWGIMIAFGNIGQTGSTSLDVVAPGISEALITTAIGLAAAIPAVIGFNYLQGRIKALVSEIEGFSSDFLNIVQKTIAAQRQ
jgi:biopolymer transport protein TolQ